MAIIHVRETDSQEEQDYVSQHSFTQETFQWGLCTRRCNSNWATNPSYTRNKTSHFIINLFDVSSACVVPLTPMTPTITRIMTFLTRNFSKTNPPCDFFASMSNLTKVSFGQIVLDLTVLTGFFLLTFWLGFFMNHHDNNVIWAIIKNICSI